MVLVFGVGLVSGVRDGGRNETRLRCLARAMMVRLPTLLLRVGQSVVIKSWRFVWLQPGDRVTPDCLFGEGDHKCVLWIVRGGIGIFWGSEEGSLALVSQHTPSRFWGENDQDDECNENMEIWKELFQVLRYMAA